MKSVSVEAESEGKHTESERQTEEERDEKRLLAPLSEKLLLLYFGLATGEPLLGIRELERSPTLGFGSSPRESHESSREAASFWQLKTPEIDFGGGGKARADMPGIPPGGCWLP